MEFVNGPIVVAKAEVASATNDAQYEDLINGLLSLSPVERDENEDGSINYSGILKVNGSENLRGMSRRISAALERLQAKHPEYVFGRKDSISDNPNLKKGHPGYGHGVIRLQRLPNKVETETHDIPETEAVPAAATA